MNWNFVKIVTVFATEFCTFLSNSVITGRMKVGSKMITSQLETLVFKNLKLFDEFDP